MTVAIVARGAVSALGLGREAFAVGDVGAAAPSAWAVRHGGKPFARAEACEAERSERPAALLELALAQLVDELTANEPSWRAQSLGVVIGTSSGGFAALERALGAGQQAPADLWGRSSYFAPLQRVPALLGRAPDRLVALYGACSSSALALGLAARWVELGRCELVIAGGYDAESDWVGAGFDSLKATSAAPPRAFRRERDGMALGEGAALLALRGSSTRAYGFVEGFGATTDAVHITAPDRTGGGLARAAKLALADAELSGDAITGVSVHGTGTPYNDASEAAALREVFGARAAELWLHAFKPTLGHTLGAASALEALAVLEALQRGVWPASAGAGSPMPELAARLLDRNEPAAFSSCLKLATAFGGANAALVLSRVAGGVRARAARPAHLAVLGAVCEQLEPARIAAHLVAAPERLPRSDTLSSLAIAAAGEVLARARAAALSLVPQRTGVVVGSVGATLEADAAFGERILARGVEHAEPRRFPSTSPNACAGHVAIAFGLGGPSHAVGAGGRAALEAVSVARDWVAAGDADAMLVISAEQVGELSQRVLESHGITGLEQGALGVLVTSAEVGPALDEALIERAAEHPRGANVGFSLLLSLAAAAGLPGPSGFGSVRPPE